MRLKGPIEKDDPNAVRKKLSPKAQEQIEKKAYEDNEKGTSNHGDLLKFELLYFYRKMKPFEEENRKIRLAVNVSSATSYTAANKFLFLKGQMSD